MQILAHNVHSLSLSGLLLCLSVGMLQAAEKIPVGPISIPKIADFKLDGQSDEWKDRGIVVSRFAEDALPSTTRENFSAQLRVAWTETGLIVAADLHSNAAWNENDSMRNAYSKDSLELFLRQGSAWKNLVQAVIAPGFDSTFDDARSYMWDYRGNPEEWQDEPAHVHMARHRDEHGGSIEVLIPWRQLRLDAQVGTEVEFRININNLFPEHGRKQFTWRRADGDTFQKLRLAESAAAVHISSSAWFVDSDPFQIGFALAAQAEDAGKTFTLKQGELSLLSGQLSKQGDSANAVYWLARNSIAADGAALTLELDGQTLCTHTLSNPIPNLFLQMERAFIGRGYRGNKSLIDQLTPRIPSLLSNDPDAALAQAVMPNPQLATLIGMQSLQTTWYDNAFNKVSHAKEAGRYAAVTTATFSDGSSLCNYQSAIKLPASSLKALSASLGLSEADLETLQATLDSGLNQHKALIAKIAVAMHGGAAYPQEAQQKWMHELRRSLGTEIVYPFAERLPTDYATDKEKLWPAIIYLHGSNGRLPSQQKPMAERLSAAPNRDLLGWAGGNPKPFAMFALQSNGGWEPDAVLDTVDRILANYQVDPDRLIIMGFSMGGMGTWRCAVEKADRWAAAVPIAARGDQAHHVERVGSLPIWVVNGDADRTTTLEDAMTIVNAMKEKNIAHKLTVLPGVGHGGSQNGTFETEGIWEWLASKKRSDRK